MLGGARSGKSRYAHEMALSLSDKVLFVATAEPLDSEMDLRIRRHREQRPDSWRTIEAPCNVAQAIRHSLHDARVVLLDCVTLLVSNIVTRCSQTDAEEAEKAALAETDELVEVMATTTPTYILVSNEVGSGIVPDNPLGRAYRDILGAINQKLACSATEVYFMVSGLPIKVK